MIFINTKQFEKTHGSVYRSALVIADRYKEQPQILRDEIRKGMIVPDGENLCYTWLIELRKITFNKLW